MLLGWPSTNPLSVQNGGILHQSIQVDISQYDLNKANHNAQHLNTPEAPYLQSANYLC
jgi:hypothetical protein